MQNVAAQQHSLAFLQLEGINLFHSPSWILSYASSRFQPTSFQAKKLDPDLQGHSTEQVLPISTRDNISLSTCQAAALPGDCMYHSCLEGFVKRFFGA